MTPQTKEKLRMHIVIDDDMHYKIRMEAAEERIGMSDVVDRALREYYERKNGAKPRTK